MSSKEYSLSDVPLLSDVSDEVLDDLETRSWIVEGNAESPIYYADDTANLIYFLMDGKVRLFYSTSEERQVTLEFLEPKKMFGELSLVDFEVRGESAESVTDSVLKVISGEYFREKMEDDNELFSEIFDYINQRRWKIQNRLKTLVYEDARKKIIYILLDLSKNLGLEFHESGMDSVDITHEGISKMAGLARPTTTKILNEMQDEELINIGNSEVEINEPMELREQINLVR